MKRLHGVLSAFLFTSISGALDEKSNLDKRMKRGKEILKYGEVDSGHKIRYYDNYCLSYNQRTKTPSWVSEHLNIKQLKDHQSHKRISFRRDADITEKFSSTNSDYTRSGWSRGHMAMADNSQHSKSAWESTFCYANVVPQDFDNNNYFWNKIEYFCKSLCGKYSDVRIVSGPLWLPTEIDGLGRRFVKYEVIGNNNVHVPTHLFKVVLAENESKDPDSDLILGAFIVPNIPLEGEDLTPYQETLEKVERAAGLTFFPSADRDRFKDLCSVETCNLQPF